MGLLLSHIPPRLQACMSYISLMVSHLCFSILSHTEFGPGCRPLQKAIGSWAKGFFCNLEPVNTHIIPIIDPKTTQSVSTSACADDFAPMWHISFTNRTLSTDTVEAFEVLRFADCRHFGSMQCGADDLIFPNVSLISCKKSFHIDFACRDRGVGRWGAFSS